MTLWTWILLACLLAFLTKLVGYLVPAHVLEDRRVLRTTTAMTIGMLSALVMLNTLAVGSRLLLDARLLALAVAGLALWRRVPFLLVVVLGAVAAALGRVAGLP